MFCHKPSSYGEMYHTLHLTSTRRDIQTEINTNYITHCPLSFAKIQSIGWKNYNQLVIVVTLQTTVIMYLI